MFVHLRLHSEYSIVDSTVRLNEAVSAAAADGQAALALTDLGNCFGALKFFKAAQRAGVQAIVGAEVLVEDLLAADRDRPLPRLLLLVQNHQGWLHLCELLSRAWGAVDARAQTASVRWQWVCELSEGLIALSGAQAGPLGAALLQDRMGDAQLLAAQCAQVFPQRFYIELQRAGRADDEICVNASVALAARMGLPVVATHPVQFMKEQDFQVHEVRVCIAQGELLSDRRRPRRFTPQQYFYSTQQMHALFADIPSALSNAVEIARRCHFAFELGRVQLPHYPAPQGMSAEAHFRQLAAEGLQARLLQRFADASVRAAQQDAYTQRLAFEIGIILKMGFEGYFLIVADFIDWARSNACPVGPGRGSGAGSLVAYALGITDLDPLAYGLLFERFLNPERVSMPDFDIDFCPSNRDRVIDYVKERYGKQAVSQIATFGTLAARAVIRDVGRVLDMGYSFCEGIGKLIPNKPSLNVTLQAPPAVRDAEDKTIYAIADEPQLAARMAREDDVRTLIEMAQKLEGLTRNVGMHAGGVLIAPGRLSDFCPLYQQPGSTTIISQFDKDDVEAVGLVKFDFLGLSTLTILDLAREMIRARHAHAANFSYENLALDDAPTYELFQQGRTEAIFQFESTGMQSLLRDARPTRFEELFALIALYRPGPMECIPSFVARKHGREAVEYPHPLLQDLLAETYGIMVYQEQVMQTAQILGGYSLGGADLLRRAMGKKKPEEMAQHGAIFRQGAAQNGIPEAQADAIFKLMEKFADYGFNKSHAAAYSLLAYHTAWVKTHYSAEFFCANMTVEMGKTDRLKILQADAQGFGITLQKPDINSAQWRFEPVDAQHIRYGLGAIKGAGEAAIADIVNQRQAHGPYSSLFNFCARVDRSRVTKRTLEALIKAGAFDALHPHRAALLAGMGLAFEYAAAQEANAQQGGLFDEGSHGSSTQEPELPDVAPWSLREQLINEKAALGFCLSGHLFDEHAAEVRQFAPRSLLDIEKREENTSQRERWQRPRDEATLIAAGIVGDLRFISSASRGKVALFQLEDGSAKLQASADEAIWAHSAHALADDALLIVQAHARIDNFSGNVSLNVQRMWDLPAARCHFGKYLHAVVRTDAHNPQDFAQSIAAIVRNSAAQVQTTDEGADIERSLPLRLQLHCPMPADSSREVRAELQLGPEARCYPDDNAMAAWAALLPQGAVRVCYERAATQ